MTDLLNHEQTQDQSLPDGWETATLQELGEINPRFGKDELPEDLEVTFLPMKCVEELSGKIDVSNSREVSEVRKGYTPFQEEDVIFAKITPCMENGKMAVARGLKNAIGFGSSEFHVVRPHGSVSRDLLFYFLVRSDFRKEAERNMTGSAGQRRVPTGYIKEARMPLPPFREQRRIVEKIGELFTKLDAGVRSLEQARAQLKSYRRSVLKAAVEGELSREWREAHRDELEPASELLERILQERREKFAGKKYKEPVSPDTSELPALREGWEWLSLDQASECIVDCLHSTPKFTHEGEYCIDTNCIAPGRILFNRARKVPENIYKERIKRLQPEENDILFAREGTIGTAVLVPSGVDLCLGQRMMMFRSSTGVSPRYFMWVLLSPLFESQWKPRVVGTTAPHVNIRDLRVMRIPLPSLDEQQIIVEEVERRLSVVDKLEATVEANLKQAAGLHQSILKRAFSGELVPQDPDDEPASVLLERIKSERRAAKPKSRTGGRKRNTKLVSDGSSLEHIDLFDS